MEITKAIRSTPGRTRTVYPLSDPAKIQEKYLDPNFAVEVKEESNIASARRWDRFKWDPSNKKDPHFSEKAMKVGEAAVSELVVNVIGLTNNGEEVDLDDARGYLTSVHVYTTDDEPKSLWSLTQEAVDEQKKEEAGN